MGKEGEGKGRGRGKKCGKGGGVGQAEKLLAVDFDYWDSPPL